VQRVFLSLPNLHGHRQVYCRQFCDYFLTRGFTVTVAAELEASGEYRQLATLIEDPRVTFVPDTWRRERKGVRRLRGLTAAARSAQADVTFLAEADELRAALVAQITHPSLRLPGRRVGLFIRTPGYIHEVERSARSRLFHEVAGQHLPLLESAMALDEVFVGRAGGRYIWMPDIGLWPSEDALDPEETDTWRAQVSAFLAAQGSRPVVVYVGMPQERRNYARLLDLASDVDGCFIHCGALHDPTGYPLEETPAHRELAGRSALLEFGRFYQSFETARVTLEAARSVVLPYDAKHLTSSGVMLQALLAGRPVLVPDRGLLAERVRRFRLGWTYRPDDWSDMRDRFLALEAAPPEGIERNIRIFLDYFNAAQFEAAMDVAMGLPSAGPRLPGSV
jgi:glycosyltransferase involved in cell wall biosynthesis